MIYVVRIPLSNNEVERTIRHSVMGRKNFYGSRSINGADVTATLIYDHRILQKILQKSGAGSQSLYAYGYEEKDLGCGAAHATGICPPATGQDRLEV